MMTLTPQLRKIAIKKRASHPSSIREPDLDLRKLVDKLERAEITMKLEETENLKLHYVNRIETITTHINNIQESDVDLSEKITEILNIYEKSPNFKDKPSFKKWCNYCRRYGHSFAECRQKQQDNQNKPQKYKEPNKSFYQYMKKAKIYQTKTYTVTTALENHSQVIQIIHESNHHITQVIELDLQNNEIHEISHKTDIVDQIVKIIDTETSIHDRTRTEENMIPVPTQILGIDTIPTIDNRSRNSSYNRYRSYSNNRNRSYSNNRNQYYPNNRSINIPYKRANYQRSNDNYQNRSRNNSQNRNLSYNNKQRIYSQSPHRNKNNYPDS